MEGILFQDITTLLLDPKAFKDTIDLFVERYKDKGISVVAGTISLPLDSQIIPFASVFLFINAQSLYKLKQ